MLCVGYIYNEDSMLSSRFLSSDEDNDNKEGNDPLDTCADWCLSHPDPWDMKCTYKHCNGCIECFDQDLMTPRKEDGTPLKIDFYGGSISVGCDFLDHKNRRFSALVGKALGVETSNLAIPATGVSQNLLCGIDPADIIISEFRINEFSSSNLDEWYGLLAQRAKHVIILELWSWLTPPTPNSQTLDAYKRLQDKSKFSVINLSEQDKNVWPCLVPSFYNYTTPNPFSGEYIPKECYAFAEGEECTSETAFRAIADRSGTKGMTTLRSSCGTPNPRAMQHGQPPYHQYVADQIVHHLQNVVFPKMIVEESFSKADSSILRQEQVQSSVCFGQWGKADQIEERKLPALVLQNNGFEMSSPFSGREDKVTLNANNVSSSVVLSCPKQYQSIKIAWVAHTWQNETVFFSVQSMVEGAENEELSTSINLGLGGNAFRVLKFSPPTWEPPLKITLLQKESDFARLEIAKVLCTDVTNPKVKRLLNEVPKTTGY